MFRLGENGFDVVSEGASSSDRVVPEVSSEPGAEVEARDVVVSETGLDAALEASVEAGMDSATDVLVADGSDVVTALDAPGDALLEDRVVDAASELVVLPEASVPDVLVIEVGPDASCAMGTACGAFCVDLTSSAEHCGRCNNPCAGGPRAIGSCVLGRCQLLCEGSFRNCDGALANGCESDGNTDPNNCGACGTVCEGGRTCQAGMCACPAGTFLCGGSCQVEANNRCGASCADCTTITGRLCQLGVCACPAGTMQCGGSCQTEANNRCGPSCMDCTTTGRMCVSGACTCGAGKVLCGTSCRNEDDSHCGASCANCSGGQRCRSGSCS